MKYTICIVQDCEMDSHCKNLCQKHYSRKKRAGTTQLVEKTRETRLCEIDGCEGKHVARGYCSLHYGRWKTHGDPLKTLRDVPKNGTTKSGYKILKIDGKFCFEHRYFMEQYLGRKLYKHENVHHKNGMRDDNRFKNLELWSTSQPKGQRVEDKIEWMKEFLAEYGMKVVYVV